MTNDFPPRRGGIQSYLQNLVDLLDPDEIVVYAPKWRGGSHQRFDAQVPYRVYRHPTTLMLPTPFVARRAATIIRDEHISTVWFGAAAPLAVMAPYLRRVGARRVVASTHGHEVGWSMLPVARQILRYIGNNTDAITFVSHYTRGRFASAFGPRAALEYLPPGVDVTRFAPNDQERKRIREKLGLGERPTILCLSRLVPRKGQDVLIRALPLIRRAIDDAVLVIAGGGPYAETLHELARTEGVADFVVFTGAVPAHDLAAYHTIADVFAMPARTRAKGLDVEGLGIVYLEASATGVPVVAGNSGGAPETVRESVTGTVVDGTDVAAVAFVLIAILSDPRAAAEMGRQGRLFVEEHWQWSHKAARLRQLL